VTLADGEEGGTAAGRQKNSDITVSRRQAHRKAAGRYAGRRQAAKNEDGRQVVKALHKQ